MNPISATSCISCGASKEESTADYFTKNIKEPISRPVHTEIYTHSDESENKSEMNKKSSFKFDPTLFKISGIILAVLLLITGIMFALIPKTKTFTLTDHYWERHINIESYETVDESDWYVPDGGRVQYTREEIKDYEPVLDHYKTVTKTRRVKIGSHIEYIDNGDGSFDEKTVDDYGEEEYTEEEPVYKDQPIYATKYYYEIERWVFKRAVSTNGYDHNPIWGEVVLADNEREASRTSKYYVLGYYKQGKSKKIKVDETMWNQLKTKRTYIVKTNSTGIVEVVE